MKLFNLEVVSAGEIKSLKEVLTLQQRQLEDIGWIAINKPQFDSQAYAKEMYDAMVNRSRLAYIKNPIVAQAVNLTTTYTFGDGITTPNASAEDVQIIIDKFWNDIDNKISLTKPEIQLKLSNKLQIDGEIAFVFQVDIDGSVYTRLIDTLSIEDIIYDKADSMRPLFYKRTVSGKTQFIPDWRNGLAYLSEQETELWKKMLQDYEIEQNSVLKNSFVYHVKINNDILDKRGIPEIYRGLDWINANNQMASDMASFIKAQAQYAWKKKITGSKSQVDAMKVRLGQNPSLTNPRNAAGSTIIENQMVENEAIGLPSSTGQLFETGIRRSLLMIAANFGIMEHYFGDPSTGNLATATAMELPMLKKFRARQKLWEGIFDEILSYVLDMSLFKTTDAFEYNEVKNRLVLSGKDFSDRNIDIDFPPILEQDLKSVTEAMVSAKNAGLVPIETAQKYVMTAMKLDNIEQEMQKEYYTPPVNPLANAFSDAVKADAQNPAKEAQEYVARLLKEGVAPSDFKDRRKNAMTLASKNKEVLAKMNGYLKEIASHYNALAHAIKWHKRAIKENNGYRVEVPGLTANLNKFKKKMIESAEKYYPHAIRLAENYVRQHALKEGNLLEKASPKKILKEQLDWNESFLNDSLIPDMTKKLLAAQTVVHATKEKAEESFIDDFYTFEKRVGSYAGAFWTVEERAVKIIAEGSGMKANFVGVDDDKTCDGCANALAGNPYDIDEAPIPGEQDCLTQCRHALQIVGDNDLTESDIQLLRNAEKQAKNGLLKVDKV